MAAAPALAYFSNLLSLSTRDAGGEPVDSGKLDGALKTLFPDLLVHGTRSYLLGTTASLSKVSTQAHHYFTRISQILAFERMMRSFARLPGAASPFPVDTALNYWGVLFLAHQATSGVWGYPAPKPAQQPVLPFFGAMLGQPQMTPSVAPAWSDYASLFTIPAAAMLAAAPAVESSWNLGARSL
jgi:hypothetical protein